MGMKGCAWLLKWSGGTEFACLSLESRYGLGLVKVKESQESWFLGELRLQKSTLGASELILKWTEAKSYFQTSQRIDSSPSESTLMRATWISTISKLHESTLKGSRVDSKLDRDDFSFETLQGVDSEWPKSTPAFKMSFKEAGESTRAMSESIPTCLDF
ncbi:hypothetical protein PIB30_088728 [Stylosanthes scabra]|uniref:Uncharacterized protein n=1 Tax=Stylosanthes scabra TaxID=79078 RepID=A0ABU6TUG9_9FABA|nr:hypothetical protein [Stylosanthes scabra]